VSDRLVIEIVDGISFGTSLDSMRVAYIYRVAKGWPKARAKPLIKIMDFDDEKLMAGIRLWLLDGAKSADELREKAPA